MLLIGTFSFSRNVFNLSQNKFQFFSHIYRFQRISEFLLVRLPFCTSQLDKEGLSTCPDQDFPSKDEQTSGFFGLPIYFVICKCFQIQSKILLLGKKLMFPILFYFVQRKHQGIDVAMSTPSSFT